MTNWSEKIVSLSFDENQILKWIMELYNNNQPFDIDPTFSTGRFWKKLIEPKLKFDMYPQRNDIVKSDCRHLPLESNSINSIMFDPPFVVAPSPKPGIIRDRFSCYKNVSELWSFYSDSLSEFWRILNKNGLLVFKCQDIVSSSTNHMSHAMIMVEAQKIGFYIKDLFVLGRKNVLWSPNMANQKHARKNHCYFLVLTKEKINKQKLCANFTDKSTIL